MPSPIYRSRNASTNPVQPDDDPLNALATFLGRAPGTDAVDSTQVDAPMPADPRRNNVRVDLLRKQLGLGADPLDSVSDNNPTDPLTQRRSHYASLGSQQELEDAADQQHREQQAQEHEKHLHALEDFFLPQAEEQRAALQKDKMEPINVQGQTARDVAGINSQAEIEKAKLTKEGAIGAAEARAAGAQTRPLPSGLMERVAGGAESIDQLNTMRGQLSGPDAVSIGPVAGRMQNLLQMLPLIPADTKFASFSSQSAALANSVIKSITGAQMSEPEAARLMKQIPTENDKPEVWMSKADTLEQTIRGLNIRVGLLHRGVPAEYLDRFPVELFGQRPEMAEHIIGQMGGGNGAAAAGGGDDLGADWGR